MDDFTADNGATLIAPGSHRFGERAGPFEHADLVPVVMDAGSVLVYDGRLVHGAGANSSDRGRLGFIAEFVPRWLRPSENHTLAVPQEIARYLDEDLQKLLGYNQRDPYFGFVAGRPPLEWLRSRPRGAAHEAGGPPAV